MKDDTVEAIRIRAKWENDDYICRGHILNGMSDSLFDVYQNVESAKELWDSLESKYMEEDASSKKFLLPPSWKDFKHTLKHGTDDLSLVQLGSHLRIEESLRAQDSDKGKGKEVGGPSVNMNEEGKNKNKKQNKGKKRGFMENNSGSSSNKKPMLECWKCGKTGHFKRDCRSGNKKNANDGGSGKTYEPVEDGSVLYMGDDHFAPVHGRGSVVLEFSSGKSITLFNVLYVPKLRFGYYNNGMFMLNLNNVLNDSDSVYMSSSAAVNSSLWHARLGHDEALDKFRIYKTKVELQQNDLVKILRTDKGGEYYDPVFFQSIGIIHETIAPCTLQQNGVAKRKNKAIKEMVNSMDIVRLPDPKIKTLDEKGIDCIFVGYAEHSKAYRFYVIEPNDSVSINSIIKSRDAIFNENRFSSIPRPKDIIPNSNESQKDDHSNDVPSETLEPYRDATFWKEAIDDEIGYIMENNTWVVSDLPPGCKHLGCKWIFKRKMKVDGTIDKFKARLAIQGFRQKEGIDYFDTYAPFARITTIRLLLALADIHNLVIYQMDVKIAFLNGDLKEEVYMKQPEGFVMPGNEHNVCKLVKSLYGLKQAPKQCHQKFNEVVLSSGVL
ncbi:zinc finger, CCHC-type containing protein [Tanacetum coccineum]